MPTQTLLPQEQALRARLACALRKARQKRDAVKQTGQHLIVRLHLDGVALEVVRATIQIEQARVQGLRAAIKLFKE